MPGLAGFFAAPALKDPSSLLARMSGSLVHESFHRQGMHWEPHLRVGVGWVRHHDAATVELPFWNGSRDVGVIFTGEHFGGENNVPRALGEWYETEGDRCVERLNGWFGGVLLDLRRRRALLFNDRYGLHRIYYHENAQGLFFASEAKALLAVLPELRRLDPRSLAELFACGCALQNRTLFQGLSLLPGGSLWTAERDGVWHKASYFDRRTWQEQEALPPTEYYHQLKETFTRVLPRYLVGGERVGVSLTGGLDSRMIMAGARLPEGALRCHTFGGLYRECADVRLARRIAAVCRQPHEVIPVTPDFFDEFPRLAERCVYLSDGAMDVMGAVELFMNRQVRERTPIRLTGNYGSEILRGNVAFRLGRPDRTLFDPGFAVRLADVAETYHEERTGQTLGFIAFKQVPWYHYARLAVEQSQLTVRSPFLDNELVALAFRAPTDPAANRVVAHHYIADLNPDLAAIPTDRGVVGRDGARGGRLAHFCQEFMPRVEYLFDYGMPPWLSRLNRMLEPLAVDRFFLGRQKFYHFRPWYRNELAPYVKEMLLDARTLSRPYLSRRRVEQVVQEHTSGRANHTLSLHKLLSSEIIERCLVAQHADVAGAGV